MITEKYQAVLIALLSIVTCNVDAALTEGSVLHFSPYIGGSTIPADGNGSWFGSEPSTFGIIGITSHEGLILGTTQTPSGSHSGAPDGSESPSIDIPHDWYGDTGMLGTVSDANILSATGNTAVIDFSGFTWSWAGNDNIAIYDSGQGDSGTASVVCAVDCGIGDTYMLDYAGHIPVADPSGLGAFEVIIHMEGTVSAVPVPAAAWLFGSGLLTMFITLGKRSRTAA